MMREEYNLSFAEALELESETGLDVYSNDGQIFIDSKEITRTIGNVLRYGMDYQREMDVKATEMIVERVGTQFYKELKQMVALMNGVAPGSGNIIDIEKSVMNFIARIKQP